MTFAVYIRTVFYRPTNLAFATQKQGTQHCTTLLDEKCSQVTDNSAVCICKLSAMVIRFKLSDPVSYIYETAIYSILGETPQSD
jgi:hypothetical protein